MGELMEWEMWDRAGDLLVGEMRERILAQVGGGSSVFFVSVLFFYFMKMAWRNFICDSFFFLLPSSFLRIKIPFYSSIPNHTYLFLLKKKKKKKKSKKIEKKPNPNYDSSLSLSVRYLLMRAKPPRGYK